jgi:hypothetical protein
MRSKHCIMRSCAAFAFSLQLCFISTPVAAPIFPFNEAGNSVCLFESGTKEIRKAIAVNDTLVVYHLDNGNLKQTGKIVVLGYNSNYNISGIIIDGTVNVNDVAIKNEIACIIISVGKPC